MDAPRHWRWYVATGIALSLLGEVAIANPPNHGAGRHQASATSQQAPQDHGAPSLDGAAQRIAAALTAKNAYDQSAQGQKDTHDAAQAATKAAFWAMWMCIAAAFETAITLVGVVLVGFTLREAKRTADETAKSAAAAIEAAKEARTSNVQNAQSGERQTRAYLAVQPGGIKQTAQQSAVGDVVITNLGHLPAHAVHAVVRIRMYKTKDVRKFEVSEKWFPAERTIHPGDSMRRSSTGSIDPRKIYKSNAYVFVFGTVYYNDGFGKPRFTRFCHRYPAARVILEGRPMMPGRPEFGTMQTFAETLIDASDARHHQYGNDAD